jgi:hypothetical protein
LGKFEGVGWGGVGGVDEMGVGVEVAGVLGIVGIGLVGVDKGVDVGGGDGVEMGVLVQEVE